MPYSVTTQDGFTLNDIPDELEPNSPEVIAKLEKLRARNTATQEIAPTRAPRGISNNSGFIENVAKGLGSGFTGMLESSALGAATLLEEEAELSARSKIQEFFDIDMLKGADEDSISYKLASGIGSIAALAPAALAGPAALPVAGAVAAGAGAGEASERARAYGATEEERSSAALRGSLIGLTEVAPLGRLSKAFKLPGLTKALDKLGPKAIENIGSRVRNAAVTGLAEGAQEGAAAILQNLNEQGYNPERELVDTGVLEEAAIGGGAGAILQALADVLIKGKERGTPKDTSPAETTEGVVPDDSVTPVTPDERTDEEIIAEENLAQEKFDASQAGQGIVSENVQNIEEETVSAADLDAVTLGAAETDLSDVNIENALAKSGLAEENRDNINVGTGAVAQRKATEKLTVQARNKDVDVVSELSTRVKEGKPFDVALAEVSEIVQGAPNVIPTNEAGSGDSVPTNTQASEITEEATTQVEEVVEGGVDSVKQGVEVVDAREDGQPAPVKTVKQIVEENLAIQRGKERKNDLRPDKPLSVRAQLNDRGTAVGIDVRERVDNFRKNKTNATTGKKFTVAQAEAEIVKEIEVAEANLATTQAKKEGLTEVVDEAIVPKPVSSDTSSAPADSNVTVDESFVSSIGLTGNNKVFGDKLLAVFGADKDSNITNRELANGLQKALNAKGVKPNKKTQEYINTYAGKPNTELASPAKFEKLMGTDVRDEVLLRKAATAKAESILEGVVDINSSEAKELISAYVEKRGGVTTSGKTWKKLASKNNLTPQQTEKLAKELDSSDLSSLQKTQEKGLKKSTAAKKKAVVEKKKEDALIRGKREKYLSEGKSDEDAQAQAEADVAELKLDKSKPPATEDNSPQFKAKQAAESARLQEEYLAAGNKITLTKGDISKLPASYINELDGVVTADIQKLVREGKLKQSLIKLAAKSTDSRVKRIASVLAAAVGTAKVKTADGPDSFVSADGTLYIAEGPVYIHTLLHEATHSAVNKILDNRGHPATRKLETLFKQVKPQLGTAYGAKDVKEFVSEAMSNSEFQQLLAGLNPDSSPVSALDRFFRAVANFVRSLLGADTKVVGSALDATDQAIIQLLSPSPDTRGAGDTYSNATRDGVEKVIKELGLVQKGFSAPTPKFKKQFGKDGATWLDSVESIATKLEALQLLDTQAVGDVAEARGYGDLGNVLHKDIQKLRGAMDESDKYIGERVKRVARWAQKNPEKNKTMGELIYSQQFGATIHQVDPTIGTTKDPSAAIEKYAFDSDAFKTWQEQRESWDALGKDGQAIYVYLRDTYKQQYKQLERTVTQRMDDVLGKEESAKLKTTVFDKMFDRNTLEVYFPLVRHGKYKLAYTPAEVGIPRADHENYVVEMFESRDERNRAEVAARDSGATDIKTTDGDMTAANFRNNAPEVGFVNDVLSTLTKNNVEDSVQDEVVNLFINSLPETSFARSLKGRSGIAGYEKDPLVAMRSKAFDIGRQTQRIDYAGRIRATEAKIREKALALSENNPKSGTTSAIGNELVARAQFAVNGASDKFKEGVVKNINQVAFIYTIGFNASSAIVNLSQLALVVGPMLGAEFGHIKAGKAMTEAMAMVKSSGNTLQSYFDMDMNKATGEFEYTLKKDLDPKIAKEFKDYEVLINMASSRSYLTQSYLADAMGLDEGTQAYEFLRKTSGAEASGRLDQGNKASKLLNSVSSASAIMFNAGEKFNRQVTLVAAYKLSIENIQSREKGKKEDERMSNTDIQKEAAEDALYKSMEYNGGAVLETGSRISAEGVGRVAFMYKNYGLRMYITMFKTGKQALELSFAPKKGETAAQKEERVRQRKIAWGKLRAIHLSSLLIAGIQGMPIYGAVALVMDLYLDDDEDDADTVVRKYFKEGWFKGPLVDALGVDFSKRVRLNSLIFEANRYSRSDSIEEDLFYHFGGPAFSTGKRMFRAGKDFSDGEIQRGIESALPAGLTNVLRNSPIGRYQQDEAMETRRGDVIYDDLTTGDFFSGMVGFPPTGYTFAQEQSNIEQGIDKAVGRERSRLLKQYYVARRQGDYPESKKVFKDMLAFSKKHPSARINYESLKRSYKGHQRTTAKMHNGTTLSPMMKRVLEEQRKEYDTSSLFD